jgi:hypothetical protein
MIERRRENIAASNGVRSVASHTPHAIFFDCALRDTHWPRFFENLHISHARCDTGGRFSTVSSCTSGDCREPRLVACGFRPERGCTDGHQAITRAICYWSIPSPTSSDRRQVRRISRRKRRLLHQLGTAQRTLRRTGLLRRAQEDRERALERAQQVLGVDGFDAQNIILRSAPLCAGGAPESKKQFLDSRFRGNERRMVTMRMSAGSGRASFEARHSASKTRVNALMARTSG